MNPCESFKFNCWSFLQSLEIMSHPSGKISIRYPITEELLRGIFRYKTEEVTGVGLYEVCVSSDIIMVIKKKHYLGGTRSTYGLYWKIHTQYL
jgi:hypothetical protein